MFGDLLNNLKNQNQQLQQKLEQQRIEASAGNGAVTAVVNGKALLLDLRIDDEKIDWQDREQVLDLIIVAVNEAVQQAMELERQEGKRILESMLPPGFGNLLG
ncbi:MAG: nucleoid-associated protein [Saprospiraceae bacterium]|nr:MAG: nucleoid-associated protein [Saprospiraceae bacterium]